MEFPSHFKWIQMTHHSLSNPPGSGPKLLVQAHLPPLSLLLWKHWNMLEPCPSQDSICCSSSWEQSSPAQFTRLSPAPHSGVCSTLPPFLTTLIKNSPCYYFTSITIHYLMFSAMLSLWNYMTFVCLFIICLFHCNPIYSMRTKKNSLCLIH